MFDRKIIDDINRSAPTLVPFRTDVMDGFALRLFDQYGVRRTLRALPKTVLDPLRSGWIRRRAEPEPIHDGCRVV